MGKPRTSDLVPQFSPDPESVLPERANLFAGYSSFFSARFDRMRSWRSSGSSAWRQQSFRHRVGSVFMKGICKSSSISYMENDCGGRRKKSETEARVTAFALRPISLAVFCVCCGLFAAVQFEVPQSIRAVVVGRRKFAPIAARLRHVERPPCCGIRWKVHK